MAFFAFYALIVNCNLALVHFYEPVRTVCFAYMTSDAVCWFSEYGLQCRAKEYIRFWVITQIHGENLLFALDSATDSVAFFLINDLYRRIRDTYYISDRFYPFTPVSPFSEKGDGQDSFFKWLVAKILRNIEFSSTSSRFPALFSIFLVHCGLHKFSMVWLESQRHQAPLHVLHTEILDRNL